MSTQTGTQKCASEAIELIIERFKPGDLQNVNDSVKHKTEASAYSPREAESAALQNLQLALSSFHVY